MTSILYVAPTMPNPVGIGLQRRAWAHLECLCTIGEVQLVVLLTAAQCQAQGGEAGLEPARKRCADARIVEIQALRSSPSHPGPLQLLWRRVRGFGQPDYGLAPGAAADQLLRTLMHGPCDLLFCFRTLTFNTLYGTIGKPRNGLQVVVDFDDVESVSRARELRFTRRDLGVEASLAKGVEVLEQRRWEGLAQRRAAAIGVCSALDATRLRARHGKAEVMVIPNTVPHRDPLPVTVGGPEVTLLLVGAMNYEPNEDAALFFAQEVLPELKKQLDGKIRLMIVGRSPRQRVLDLQGDASISVHADVPSVEAYYQQADIVIAPIRFGGGTRIKIIEALAMGRPVVSTRIGAEGLDLVDGQHLLLADSAHGIAQACYRLCTDPALRSRLAQEGHEAFLAKYEEGRVCNDTAQRLRRLMA
jgi:glycosyltransferase involved in cell wall biosynthesis